MPLTPVIITDLSVSYGERPVLSGIDLLAQPGRRIGLVGENGAGKSTLLRAVAGRLPARPGAGRSAPDDLVLLGQEPPFRDRATVAEVLATTLGPLRRAVADVERLAALDDAGRRAAYGRALELALAHDAWDADRRAELAAERLGSEPRPGPGRHPVGRPAHPARAGHDHDHPADLPAARRAHQPPRRRGDRGPHRLPASTSPAWWSWPATTGCSSTTLHRPRRPRRGRARHRRRGRPSLRRRLGGLRGPPARPAPLGGDVRRPAGGAHALRATAPIGTGAIAHDRGPRTATSSSTPSRAAGWSRPSPAARRTPSGGWTGREREPGAQAPPAAGVPRRPDGRGGPGAWCRPATSRSRAGCGWSAST